jgi:uncharacterized integral membrane protein
MTDHHHQQDDGFRLSAKTVVWGILALLAAIFVVQNTERTTISILFWDLTTGVWLALLIATLLGGAIGYFAARHRSER